MSARNKSGSESGAQSRSGASDPTPTKEQESPMRLLPPPDTFYAEATLVGRDENDTQGVAAVYYDGHSVLLWLPSAEPRMFGMAPQAFDKLADLLATARQAVDR